MELLDSSLYELYKELCKKYKDKIDEYFENDARKLHTMVDSVIKKLNFYDVDMDEYYSLSHEIFIYSLKDYDEQQSFNKFIYSCLYKKFCTNMTMSKRDKRKNKVKVETKDENGNNVVEKIEVPDISFDASLNDEDGVNLCEIVASDFNVENETTLDFEIDDKVENCLNKLSKIQKQIVEMKMNNISVSEIKKVLELSDSQYEDNMKSIRENPNIISFKNKKRCNQQYKKSEDIKMIYDNEISVVDVMDLDTTDSYRTDKNTLGSLLDDIEDELSPTYINRNYISQRQPFMWDEEKINKYYSRILNNQPIPEIVICEQIVNGIKVSYLIDGLQRLSYAEAFKKNLIPVKAKGAEFVNIKYRERCINENGDIKIIEKLFNIVGKYYRDLPEFLQKRFDNFNMTVTRFFNCTSEMIDYHMRNYNNHVSMNKCQYGMTNVSNRTAEKIKNISYYHSFFKDNVKVTNKNGKDGSWDEVVARSIMSMNYMEDWKKEIVDVFKFLDENATEEQFIHLNENLNRLSVVSDKSVKNLFTTTNTYIWLAVYDKFTELGQDDVKFIEFMRYFDDLLHSEDDKDNSLVILYKHQSTRDKKVVTGKIEGLITLMFEFLHIDKKDIEVIDEESFIANVVEIEKSEVHENIDIYNEDLNGSDVLKGLKGNCIKDGSKLLDTKNNPSLLAMVAYSYKIGQGLDKWLTEYASKNNTYFIDQKRNYFHMKADFDKYLKKGKVA